VQDMNKFMLEHQDHLYVPYVKHNSTRSSRRNIVRNKNDNILEVKKSMSNINRIQVVQL
jgi:hypothetical protein